jgi:signal transduction histidine kinase
MLCASKERFTKERCRIMMESMRNSLRDVARRDIVIASVVSVLGLALMYLNVHDHNADPAEFKENTAIYFGGLLPYEFAIPLFLLVTVPLLWRRVAPLGAAGAALAGLALNELLVGTDVLRCGVVFSTAFLFAFATGAHLQGRDARIGLALSLGLVFISGAVELGPFVAAVFAGVAVAVWVIGRIVQSRKRMADELELRTAELRDARDERARLEVASDRARLSGELDELLQRRLGELARMADAGARPSDAAGATATLAEIEHASRRTLEEMRAVVGVLRDDSAAPTAPQPTLTHLQALLVRAMGSDAKLTVEGNPRVLPPAVELSAYRIVEHLLAALEDAPDVEVRVRFGDNALELGVSGPARRRAKASIQRAQERARLQQGTLEATVRGGRAEAEVSLPVLTSV